MLTPAVGISLARRRENAAPPARCVALKTTMMWAGFRRVSPFRRRVPSVHARAWPAPHRFARCQAPGAHLPALSWASPFSRRGLLRLAAMTAKSPAGNSRRGHRRSWLQRFDRRLGRHVAFPPAAIIAVRLLLSLPIAWLLIYGGVSQPALTILIAALLGLSVLLDYVDGVVARRRDSDSSKLRVFDRLTDLPLVLTLLWLTFDQLDAPAVAAKLLLDGSLLILYARGLGNSYKRLRATAHYVSLFGLLMLERHWAPHLVTAELASLLLWVNAGVALTILLRRLEWLSRRRIADALSIGNLVCGVGSMVFAARGKLDISLLLLTLGAALDGMDGAAARRWGGSPIGVYMDDVADGVSYGLAPGFAIYATIGGIEGIVVGSLFALFVIARLIFFTLNKAASDPAYFNGVPSPAGGLSTMCSIVIFRERPLLVGFLVGIACTLMVAFDVQHRHLGRALASRKMRAYAAALLIVLALSAALGGFRAGVGLVLTILLLYGFSPSFAAFRRVLADRSSGA